MPTACGESGGQVKRMMDWNGAGGSSLFCCLLLREQLSPKRRVQIALTRTRTATNATTVLIITSHKDCDFSDPVVVVVVVLLLHLLRIDRMAANSCWHDGCGCVNKEVALPRYHVFPQKHSRRSRPHLHHGSMISDHSVPRSRPKVTAFLGVPATPPADH